VERARREAEAAKAAFDAVRQELEKALREERRLNRNLEGENAKLKAELDKLKRKVKAQEAPKSKQESSGLDRGYFGVMRVVQAEDLKAGTPSSAARPEEPGSGVVTTYFHRLGPVGIVMARYQWFNEPRKAK
jgi:hypothetical protein